MNDLKADTLWGTLLLALFGGGGLFTMVGKMVKGYMTAQKTKLVELEKRLDNLVPLVTCLGDCCIVLVAEVHELNPGSRTLLQVEGMLRDGWPEMFNKVFHVPRASEELDEMMDAARDKLRRQYDNDFTGVRVSREARSTTEDDSGGT